MQYQKHRQKARNRFLFGESVGISLNKDGKADSKDYVLLKRHCLGTYVIK